VGKLGTGFGGSVLVLEPQPQAKRITGSAATLGVTALLREITNRAIDEQKAEVQANIISPNKGCRYRFQRRRSTFSQADASRADTNPVSQLVVEKVISVKAWLRLGENTLVGLQSHLTRHPIYFQ
jgi:hypothetical protein